MRTRPALSSVLPPAFVLLSLLVTPGCRTHEAPPGSLPDLGERMENAAADDFLVDDDRSLRAFDSFEIFALHPTPATLRPADEGVEVFHDYPIRARAAVVGAADREAILREVYGGIARSDGTVAGCFNPRHGFRIRRGEQSLDFVICYECLSMQVHGPDDAFGNALTVRQPTERAISALWKRRGAAPR